MSIRKFITHSFTAVNIASKWGWFPGARYSNLRDVKRFGTLGFLDIDWRCYDFATHLRVAKAVRPMVTVAKDVENIADLDMIIDQAHRLLEYATSVIVVPKDPRLSEGLEELIPPEFLLGFSVPTRYGGTTLPLSAFRRDVHLLGGRPDVQRKVARNLRVVSMDCNRFTLDAGFGDYFDGEIFRPHPFGGYHVCLEDSVANINRLWEGYRRPRK